ncbi:MAG: TlpA family protein disulfide reductase [Bacteroidetes bacterium]|nr:TlpA family protein disulfide reductase [Bacteroidota bacterium]
MTRLIILLSSVFLLQFNLSASVSCKKSGRWIFEFHVKDKNVVPIELQLQRNNTLQIINHTEIIDLNKVGSSGDTIIYEFPDFYSQLYIVWTSNKTATGYYWNKNKSGKSIITFSGKKTKEDKFNHFKTDARPINLATKYKTTFSPNSTQPEPAIGLFEQDETFLSGTFLTETGDYRFLSGNIYGNKFYLSCFDGSHLFLFTGEVQGDNIRGFFFSGATYSTDFIANEDADYSLKNSFELTFKTEKESTIEFQFPKLNGETYTFPQDAKNNKLTIVQIMGTWCPNCMDETKYYLELYNKYKAFGLGIVVVGFEYSNNPAFHQARLTTFQERYNLPFTLLVGGENSKEQTSKKFPELNGIMSYPTSLFFDQQGKLIKTHTGFTGPGTGDFYINYKQEMEIFLDSLLKP